MALTAKTFRYHILRSTLGCPQPSRKNNVSRRRTQTLLAFLTLTTNRTAIIDPRGRGGGQSAPLQIHPFPLQETSRGWGQFQF